MIRQSSWDKPIKKEFPHLNSKIATGVAIIGGGITGVTAAYLLSRSGKKVTLIDRYGIGSGETGNTTAMCTIYFDTPPEKIEKNFNKQTAIDIWKAGAEAIDTLEYLIHKENIECDFKRCNAYIYALKDEDKEKLQQHTIFANQSGFSAAFNQVNELPFQNYGYLTLQNQAKFHPLKYLEQLIQKLQNVEIYTNTVAVSVEETEGKIRIKTDSGEIIADDVIIATHFPFTADIMLSDKYKPYNTYEIEAEIPRDVFLEAIYWDNETPYNYFRIDKLENNDRIILGGYDHPTGKNPSIDPYQKLEKYVTEILKIAEYKLTRQWSGQVLNTLDGLPLIGKYKNNHYIASGFEGNGMTFGTFSAMMLTDLILGKENKYVEMFKPSRLKNKTGFVAEGVAKGVEFTKEFLKAEVNNDYSELSNNSGKVVRVDGKPTALYKDENGKIIKKSAFCTHMKCIVNWNDVDKSWDCPCHGSRFAKTGEVITGPATSPLPNKD
jgi:glycine/D-amino acid oxidase-like deaminating enzyme/nitrite reductase/ring-hydroxylating ferredoxin subunit